MCNFTWLGQLLWVLEVYSWARKGQCEDMIIFRQNNSYLGQKSKQARARLAWLHSHSGEGWRKIMYMNICILKSNKVSQGSAKMDDDTYECLRRAGAHLHPPHLWMLTERECWSWQVHFFWPSLLEAPQPEKEATWNLIIDKQVWSKIMTTVTLSP